MSLSRRRLLVLTGSALASLAVVACGGDSNPAAASPEVPKQPEAPAEADPTPEAAAADASPVSSDRAGVVIYSGRTQELVEPVLNEFTRLTGIGLNARYGETAEMAATILEEGANSPADVFYSQDAGALGALNREGRLAEIPTELLQLVQPRFRSPEGRWIGVTGRARVAVHNTNLAPADSLPASVLSFADPAWKDRVGWAPTNGSFQAFVTAMRVKLGDEPTRDWLRSMRANGVTDYASNNVIVEAVISGEIHAGLVNHYYLMAIQSERPEAPARNHFFRGGDAGALVNVSGVGILGSSRSSGPALELLRHLLSESAQRYFASETFEYPLAAGVPASAGLPPIDSIEAPEIDLSDLADLEGTLGLMREAGVL